MAKAQIKRSDTAADKRLSGREAQVLKARAARLAARGRSDATDDSRSVLVVQCGDDLFGLALNAAVHVMPTPQLAAVAGHPALIGLFSYAGRPHSAIDLAVLLGLKPQAGPGFVVVLAGAPWPAALKIDAALGVLPVRTVADDAAHDGAVVARATTIAAPDAPARILSLLDTAALMDGLNASLALGVRH